jgi:hypothetical protein
LLWKLPGVTGVMLHAFKRLARYLLVQGLVIVILLGLNVKSTTADSVVSPKEAVASSSAQTPANILASFPKNLIQWIDRLAIYESGYRQPYNGCHIDVDGSRVCGCLQYKYTTFRQDVSYYLPELQNPDYLDCTTQKALALATISKDPNGWRRWWTSVAERGLGLPPL